MARARSRLSPRSSRHAPSARRPRRVFESWGLIPHDPTIPVAHRGRHRFPIAHCPLKKKNAASGVGGYASESPRPQRGGSGWSRRRPGLIDARLSSGSLRRARGDSLESPHATHGIPQARRARTHRGMSRDVSKSNRVERRQSWLHRYAHEAAPGSPLCGPDGTFFRSLRPTPAQPHTHDGFGAPEPRVGTRLDEVLRDALRESAARARRTSASAASPRTPARSQR